MQAKTEFLLEAENSTEKKINSCAKDWILIMVSHL